MKNFNIFSLTAVLLLMSSYAPAPRMVYGIKTVVIDAGHGGHDHGCSGMNSKEKHIALDVALKLGEIIEKKFPDVRVIYTRKTDVFIELHERAGIANRAKADLFICIHANSACHRDLKSKKEICNESIHGPETFVMGLHKTDENLSVARRENESVLLEKDYKTRYDGYDPTSPEANIIFSLFQNAYMNQSISFASRVQTEFEEYSGRNNRGVKQAGFLVLYRTSMPSVLIETGFLTNKNEERFLLSEKGQTDIATSIFRAFKEYKIDMEGEPVNDTDKKKDSIKVEVKNDSVSKVRPKEEADKKTTNDSATNKNSVSLTKLPADTSANNKVAKDSNSNAETVQSPVKTDSFVYYTVQIGTATNKTTQGLEKYNKQPDLNKMTSDDGMIRFTVGNFQNLNDALLKQNEMRSKGFKDAFVTAYHNNKRITLKEASDLMKKN